MKSRETFKNLLSKAVQTIAVQENKNIKIVQEELGHALGRSSGSCIEYWRRGFLPARAEDLNRLFQEITKRQGLNSGEMKRFILAAEPWFPVAQIDVLLGSLNQKHVLPVSLPRSPFIVGPPIVNPQSFYGRFAELRRILHLWKTNPLQNIAIVGEKRSGKTSLLNFLKSISLEQINLTQLKHFQNINGFSVDFQIIFVDFQDPRMIKQERLLKYILQQLRIPIPENCTLETFMDCIAFKIKRPTIIMLDELTAGLEAPELNEAFWWSMCSWVSHYANGNLAFAIASHDLPMKLAEARGKPSLFFNMFNTLELGPFNRKEALDLIDSAPIPFELTDIEWILEQSGCWPILVQVLCQARLLSLQGVIEAEAWQNEGLEQMARLSHLLG